MTTSATQPVSFEKEVITKEKTIPWQGFMNLLVVYIVWGSTYLAIRIAVQGDSGFPPYILGGTRVFAAGVIILAWSAIRGERLKPTRSEFATLFISGILLWVGGTGSLNWAEQRIDSGLASLMIAAIPVWVAIIESIIDRKLPTVRMMAALLIGFGGIAILTYPTLSNGEPADVFSIILLLLAGLNWGSGTILQSRRTVALSPAVSAGYQQLFGAIGFGVLIFIKGETWVKPSLENWLAWGYLVIFGSLFAFTAYVIAVKLVPIKIVTTYAYVNPVIAVFLGWLVLRESVTLWTFGGAALVLLSVAGIFRERQRGIG
ncbi:EamA family transporter [Chloroflexota bacterium]